MVRMATGNEAPPARPDITAFRDYREYLRDMIVYLKATRRWFSYRAFSRRAGFSSPNFLKQVADGKRNLSAASIPKFARGLELDDAETDLFEALVLLSQATTDAERNRHVRRLLKSAGATDASRLEADQYELFSQWHAPVIRELAALPGFLEETKWIAGKLWPRIRPAQAKKALGLLQRLGMLVRDSAGRLVPPVENIATGRSVRSLAIRNYHRLMLELAARALDLPTHQRNVTSITIPITEAQYAEVCSRIADLRRDLLALAGGASDDAEPREIHKVVFGLFPVTRDPVERKPR